MAKYISENKELMKEWDWEANNKAGLDPNKLTLGSHKVVHWKCNKCGHTWISSVTDRARKRTFSYCPLCTNRMVKKGINDLSITHPEFAKEWHPTKNGNLTPNMISLGSSKRAWWKCSKCGYEWQTVIRSRRRCPRCVQSPKEGYDLATLFPQIAKEWHPTKNGKLLPMNVKPKSNKKVWWKCPNNHEYLARINERTRKQKTGFIGTGCPYCYKVNRTSYPEQAICYYVRQIYPDAISQYKAKFLGRMELDIFIPSINLAIEYDGEPWHRQDKLKREQEKYFKCVKHGIKLIRIREKLPEASSQIADEHIEIIKSENKPNLEMTIKHLINEINFTNRKININLQKDEIKIRENYQTEIKDSVAKLYPQLIKEWHPTKNGNLTPNNCKAGSSYKVWWKCSKCGYEWKTPIVKRTLGGHNCLNCTKQKSFPGLNDLVTLYPHIAKEWHPTKNGAIMPHDIRPKSNRKYWWKCSKCGYEWQATGHNRIAHKSGCPACAGRVPMIGTNDIFTLYPNLKEEWDFELNKKYEPAYLPIGSHTKVWWKCSNCGHVWKAEIRRRVKGLSKCPNCKGLPQLPLKY